MASQPDVSQIIAGPGLIYIAPVGTTQPTLTWPLVWPAGWFPVGYTDAGIDLTYTPTIKEEYVDEEAAPVLDILEKEKFVIQAHLAEVSLTNLNAAISASTYNPSNASGPSLTFGSQALNYVAVGVVGPAVGGYSGRIVLCQKAITTVGVAIKITRKSKQVFPVSFDARKISGQVLGLIQDLGTGYENS
jgi:hypothetical protein